MYSVKFVNGIMYIPSGSIKCVEELFKKHFTMPVAYRGGGGLGGFNPPSEIPKF